MNADDKRHGTPAGRHAHMRSYTEVCEPCRIAHAEHRRELRKVTERKPVRTCSKCSTRRTEARDGICRDCRNGVKQSFNPEYILTGGEWINDRGIMRWVAA